ncbi:hypothetical protein ECTOBSL9_2007 [Ectothiorhodospira sp. BSL-9]|nr:hypothetical protein ECTOBSL9_2007 [Ectothiorhodospira sp. BSL-9]
MGYTGGGQGIHGAIPGEGPSEEAATQQHPVHRQRQPSTGLVDLGLQGDRQGMGHRDTLVLVGDGGRGPKDATAIGPHRQGRTPLLTGVAQVFGEQRVHGLWGNIQLLQHAVEVGAGASTTAGVGDQTGVTGATVAIQGKGQIAGSGDLQKAQPLPGIVTLLALTQGSPQGCGGQDEGTPTQQLAYRFGEFAGDAHGAVLACGAQAAILHLPGQFTGSRQIPFTYR